MSDEKCPKEYLSCYETIRVVGDGDRLCARFDDFENLQESFVGFGSTDAEAIADLAVDLRRQFAAADEASSAFEQQARRRFDELIADRDAEIVRANTLQAIVDRNEQARIASCEIVFGKDKAVQAAKD